MTTLLDMFRINQIIHFENIKMNVDIVSNIIQSLIRGGLIGLWDIDDYGSQVDDYIREVIHWIELYDTIFFIAYSDVGTDFPWNEDEGRDLGHELDEIIMYLMERNDVYLDTLYAFTVSGLTLALNERLNAIKNSNDQIKAEEYLNSIIGG